MSYFWAVVGREVGFLYGAAEPVFELDPGRLDHRHWSQGAATLLEHVC